MGFAGAGLKVDSAGFQSDESGTVGDGSPSIHLWLGSSTIDGEIIAENAGSDKNPAHEMVADWHCHVNLYFYAIISVTLFSCIPSIPGLSLSLQEKNMQAIEFQTTVEQIITAMPKEKREELAAHMEDETVRVIVLTSMRQQPRIRKDLLQDAQVKGYVDFIDYLMDYPLNVPDPFRFTREELHER